LQEAHGEIEEFRFDGAVTEPAVVLDELRSFGLLQSHKIVILDDADKFLAARDEDEPPATPPPRGGKRGTKAPRGPKTARQLMEAYAEKPVDNATLLLRAETWRPGRLDKAVQKVGKIVKCDAPNEATAGRWCVDHARDTLGCKLSPDAAADLVARIGTSRARLDVELRKLAAYAGAGAEIDRDAIFKLVGLTREEQAWVIQSALASGSPASAVAKLRELLAISHQPEQLLIWAITDLLRKLHAASRMLAAGASPGAVAGELKLWGEGRRIVLGAASRIGPPAAAQLLRLAIESDQRTKTGLGKAPRTLEALAIRIADTVRA
jgi:DNA polymerase III delta subunit